MPKNPVVRMICRDELLGRLRDSARNVFGVMADIALEECHEAFSGGQEGWLTAMIGLEGEFNGLVALHCPEALARRTAAGLLALPGEPGAREVHDALGEVVNILGGDIKLLLDGGGSRVRLSTPSVFAGDVGFPELFQTGPRVLACTLSSGTERLYLGVQVSRQ